MKNNPTPKIAVVVPCYNEEEVLPEISRRLKDKITGLIDSEIISAGSSIYFIDDGSSDKTWEMILTLHESDSLFKGLKLSRNRGHQNALLAGLLTAEGDALISIDADLQDDIEGIDQMIQHFKNGSEIVYGVRSNRETDTRFKKWTAETYYRLLQKMGVELIFNHADYRLMGRRALNELKKFTEVNLFLRGIAPQIGFKSSRVYYKRGERYAGESKYPLKKMLAFALEGITSFSDFPLKIITAMGILVSFVTLFLMLWVLGVRIFTDSAVPGWASTLVPLFFLSGVQILSLGVIGQYISKIYVESKRRPNYIIEEILE